MIVSIVGCGKKKLDRPAKARDLYVGDLFKKSARLAELISDRWFILSAKYGLIDPDLEIDPYDETIIGASKEEKEKFSIKLAGQVSELSTRPREISRLIVLAGRPYVQAIQNSDLVDARSIEDPLRGLGIGERLSWLKAVIETEEESAGFLHDVSRVVARAIRF